MVKLIRAMTVLLFCMVLAFSCKKEKPAAEQAAIKRDVILISIDTVRADYLQMYNAAGAPVPALASLANEGILFRRAIAQAPYTLPSHSTMLTGVYPVGHGVRDNVHDVLPESIPTLAELFKKNSYQTAGFAGSLVLASQTGLGRGFDFYDDLFSRMDVRTQDLGSVERPARDIFNSFKYWFDNRRQNGRYFAFLHFYDPHSPYDPPPQFAVSTSQKDLYKGEIRYVDSVLTQLFAYLKSKGAWDQTVIMATSDHGEMLLEHQEYGHGWFLYEPALHVPMILKLPAQSPIKNRDIANLVEIVDIAPTLLEAAGVEVSGMQGESLVPLVSGSPAKKNRYAFAESYFAALQMGISPLFSVQDGTYKYIEAPREELFDLSSDPGEAKNIAQEQKSVTKQMKTMLEQYRKAYLKTHEKTAQRSVSREEDEQFAALGYLGGRAAESEWDRFRDPKDFIDLWNNNLEITYRMDQGDYRKALELVEGLRASQAKPSSALIITEAKCYMAMKDFTKAERVLNALGSDPAGLNELAWIYVKTGRKEQAAAAYEKLLKENFSYYTLYDYAFLLKSSGRTREALDFVAKIQAERKEDLESRPHLAEIHLMLENWAEAERLIRTMAAERPWESKWVIQLAGLFQKLQQPQQAVQVLESYYAEFQDDPGYLLRLGILYNATSQKEREVEVLQQFVRLKPQDPRGYLYLAKAMLDTGGDPTIIKDLADQAFALGPPPDMQVFGHYILGNALARLGRKAESQKQFELAEKLEKSL